MTKKLLFVLGGLTMGGVETYITRLANQLKTEGHTIDIILLSNKYDAKLFEEISHSASIFIYEALPQLKASSWLNAFLPVGGKQRFRRYDIVHVVDLLTLGFVYLNRNSFKFDALSIGIYHSLEVSWWREKDVYFRRRLLQIYDKNISLTLFPNESTASLAKELSGYTGIDNDVLPLGINLFKYNACSGAHSSNKIISVGRLVDFKAYNKHMISALSEVRKSRAFEYYIFGDGPAEAYLRDLAAEHGVTKYVHFMGQIDYNELPTILNQCFCFIGSGTTIIEASAAGIPSIVGIESIKTPHTSGFFSDVVGYSYNEESASKRRMTFVDAINLIAELDEATYSDLSARHRKKAREFDITATAKLFLDMSHGLPDYTHSFNRWRALFSFVSSIIRFGPSALKSRFEKPY